MFAKLAQIDQGFEDESFRAVYGDHVADPETLDIEDRLIESLDSRHTLECVHEDDEDPVAVTTVDVDDWDTQDAAVIDTISADIRVMAPSHHGSNVRNQGRSDFCFAPRAELKPLREHESRTHSRAKAARR